MFLVAGMTCAGLLHVLWLWLAPPGWLACPLDGGLTLRGRRLFGANKRLRGLVILPLAATASFVALSHWQHFLPASLSAGMWPLTTGQYAILGSVAGLACMLAELPNSFAKRRLGIPPGELPSAGIARYLFAAVDRLDTPLGMMIGVSALISVRPATWLWVLLLEAAVHAALSAALHGLGVKPRRL